VVSYLILFLGTLVEADAALIAAAFLAHRGRLSLGAVVPVCIAATLTANQFWFWIARLKGRAFLEARLQTDRRYQRIHGWLQRRGTLLIPASRFLYGFRVAIPAAYGASGTAPWRFTVLELVSATVWGLTVGFAGYAFGDTLEILLSDLEHYELLIAAAVVIVGAVLALRRRAQLRAVVHALRRPVAAGGELAGAMFITARRAGRLLITHPHGRLASFAVTLGALNVVSSVVGTRILHLEWMTAWLPFEVTHGSRALMLLAGIGLIYLGRGLARRKRSAWVMALGLAALSSLLYLSHHGSILRAALSSAFALELWRQRHRFQARTDPLRLRHALLATPVLALAVTVYGLAGFRELGESPAPGIDALRAVWWTAGFQAGTAKSDTPAAVAFVWSLRLLFVLSVAYVGSASLAPVAWREFRSRMATARVAGLAWQHGIDSMSYFAKQDDKRHFTVDGRAFVGFRVRNRVAVVAGDPVGEEEAIAPLVAAFVAQCQVNDWVPVFYETSDRYLDLYRAQGLRWFKIGEEAVLHLASWSLGGGAVAKVRQFINKVRREAPDLQVVEYCRHTPASEIDDQLEEISSAWLAMKKGGEMGFNLGVFSVEDLQDKRTLIARRADGTVEAFVTWLPYRAGQAVVLDAMRHRSTARPGVMDLLIAESALLFKKEGLQAASLAMAPLANADAQAAVSPYDVGVRLIFDHFSSVYGYRTLFQYKKKFAPAWEPRHLVFPRPDLLLRIAYALVSVHYTRS
jgi:phosphatidylglycerol lysyltransferase